MFPDKLFCYLLQEKMKKRLRYAMPRIPLHKLKPGLDQEKDINMKKQPESHMGKIAEKIADAKLKRREAADNNIQEDRGGIELKGTIEWKENENETTDTTGNAGTMGDYNVLLEISKLAHQMRHKGDDDLDKKDRKQLRKIQTRLKKMNKKMQANM